MVDARYRISMSVCVCERGFEASIYFILRKRWEKIQTSIYKMKIAVNFDIDRIFLYYVYMYCTLCMFSHICMAKWATIFLHG